MSLQVFDQLVARCRDLPRSPFAVVSPTTEVALSGAMAAAEAGLIEPILVGNEATIRALAVRLGTTSRTCASWTRRTTSRRRAKSVALCREGAARGLMKGSLHTDVLMHAVLDKDTGLRRRAA